MATRPRLEGIKAIRLLHAKAKDVLLDDWDPIGIRDEPNAQDEYGSYVGPICNRVSRGDGDIEIAEHRRRIELDRMGSHRRSLLDLLPVAQKPMALRAQLPAD